MATSYLKLVGKSGPFRGPVTDAGREGSIAVVRWNHQVAVPYQLGEIAGGRQHQPIVITKSIDQTTLLLMGALITNENLLSFQLECWGPNLKGVEGPIYRIELTNAAIISISANNINSQPADNGHLDIEETVSFVYQGISWTWLESGATITDKLDQM